MDYSNKENYKSLSNIPLVPKKANTWKIFGE